jgi:hypothetical protein
VPARGFASIIFFALLAVPWVTSAAAPIEARIDGVHVTERGDGSVVSVKLRGRMKPRLLRSVERLVSIVIADVDADGDLDILASTIREGLLLWRNAGRGHFVLARLPKARDALAAVPRASGGTGAIADDEPGEGSADGAIPRAERAGNPLVLRSTVLIQFFSVLAQYRAAPTGRAPPPLD